MNGEKRGEVDRSVDRLHQRGRGEAEHLDLARTPSEGEPAHGAVGSVPLKHGFLGIKPFNKQAEGVVHRPLRMPCLVGRSFGSLSR